MARQSLTEAEITEFRARAVSAASALFKAHGLDGMSMRALATALGVSPMTAYRYFDNQEHLVSEVRRDAFDRLAHAMREADAGATPRARIVAIGEAYIRFAVADPNAYRLMFDLRPPAESRPELTRASQDSFAPLVRAVDEAIAAGTLRGDAMTVAHVVWAGLHGTASLHLADKLNFGRTVEQLSAALFVLLLE